MQQYSFFPILLAVIVLTGCRTTVPVRPMEKYLEMAEDRLSVINIPVNIRIKELEESLNQQLQGVIYEDTRLDDGDDLMFRLEKIDDISFGVKEDRISYRVPLKVWFKYNTGLAKVEGTGTISFNLLTALEISEDWNLVTHTEIEDYEWLEKPRLKLGRISLPVGLIADVVLRKSRGTITRTIDQQVQQSFKMREIVDEAWNRMYDPILVSEDYNTWLVVHPQKISMTPLQMSPDRITSTIVVESQPRVRLGEKPETVVFHPLPPFSYSDSLAEDFVIHLTTEVPYQEAERIARAEIQGETFTQGRRSVTVDDIELFGKGSELVINTKLSGWYKGNLYLTGRPFYNLRRNAIDVEDLNFTLETRNFLQRSGGWLLKGTFRKRIQEMLDIQLDYNLGELEQQLRDQLTNYQISEGIFLRGDLADFDIRNAFLVPGGIRVELALRGKLNIEITGLN